MCQPIRANRYEAMRSDCCGPCGCGCGPPFRRYLSAEEERERLEYYRDQLMKELAGVEERIGAKEK